MPDWLITIGIFAILAGVALRAITMMRASDAGGATAAGQYGKQLAHSHRKYFPGSALPVVGKILTYAGAVLLVAGAWIRLRS